MLVDDIGFPVGFPIPTVSKGIVSAEANTPFLTTRPCRLTVIHAIVNHGNSGGPLFLADTGKVIGIINAKKLADLNKDKIRLPANYQALETLGGIDPIRLSVETYNHSLDVIGDTSQLGIGFSVSSEYIQKLVGTIQ
jgi:S1-C subfamily serine protease